MTDIKKIFLNGQEYTVNYDITISNIVNYFNYDDSLLVLEYNNSICNKTYWSETFIVNNDKIEIVTIVGGG